MKLTDRVTIPPEVMARTLGGEQVILNLATGNYFGLDAVGSRIWELLVDGKSLSAAHLLLLDEYEVDSDVLERDMLALVDALKAQGLVAAVDSVR
jgi:hypothetical protein